MTTCPGMTLFKTGMRHIQPTSPRNPTAADITLVNEMTDGTPRDLDSKRAA
jgi:hypothetical protein